MRRMYDSVDPNAIPTNAQLVAGYVDGTFAWSTAGWARFPHSIHVPIAVFSSTDAGIVGDCEQGDMTPQSAVNWVVMRRRAGVDPTIYCSESTWASVTAAFDAARVARPHWWVAAYPGGGAVIPAGAVAHQYADPPDGSGGNYDISAVADYWPGVDTGDPDMQLTDKLDPNAPVGTVNEALNAVLFGIGGVRNAGQIAVAVAGIQRTLATQSTAITTLSNTVAGVDADVKAGFGQLVAAVAGVDADVKAGVSPITPEQLASLETALEATVGPAVLAALKAQFNK